MTLLPISWSAAYLPTTNMAAYFTFLFHSCTTQYMRVVGGSMAGVPELAMAPACGRPLPDPAQRCGCGSDRRRFACKRAVKTGAGLEPAYKGEGPTIDPDQGVEIGPSSPGASRSTDEI